MFRFLVVFRMVIHTLDDTVAVPTPINRRLDPLVGVAIFEFRVSGTSIT